MAKETITTTYAEATADKIWGEIVQCIHAQDGPRGFKILKDAIQSAVEGGESLAYAKRLKI